MASLATVKRGDTWRFSFIWKSNGTPIDLSDCTARMQVRKKRVGTLLGEVSSIDGITIIGIEGKVDAVWSADITAAMELGMHETDLQITFTSTGEVKSSETLTITVIEDVTR